MRTLYIAISTRPDILFSVGKAARKSKNPTTEDWSNVLKIIGNFKGTINYGLYFNGDSNLKSFSDSDFAGDKDSRKSTTGYVITYGGTPISWCSKLQHCVSISTADPSIIAYANAPSNASGWKTY